MNAILNNPPFSASHSNPNLCEAAVRPLINWLTQFKFLGASASPESQKSLKDLADQKPKIAVELQTPQLQEFIKAVDAFAQTQVFNNELSEKARAAINSLPGQQCRRIQPSRMSMSLHGKAGLAAKPVLNRL